jgi:glycosyltransferase involved in cell wall biosynthesis
MKKRKILFLGETYRADAITWIKGLEEFGSFKIITWELQKPSNNLKNRTLRLLEYTTALQQIKKIIRVEKPDMVIAERTTSYGFLAVLCGVKPVAIAQQGYTDLWPRNSILYPLKKRMQQYAFTHATLIHAWGPVMSHSMQKANVNMSKVLVLPKGIDFQKFNCPNKTFSEGINAIVTRSLSPEYQHEVILKAFGILESNKIDFQLTIVGDGKELLNLKKLAQDLHISSKVHFTGRILNTELPKYLEKANLYISMPVTEGVSASLFEAMATRCYPIVSDIPGNKSYIKHKENGQLVPVGNYNKLAQEILWTIKNTNNIENATEINYNYCSQKANYKLNMKEIANKYHTLINAKK